MGVKIKYIWNHHLVNFQVMEDILHQLMQKVWNVDSFDITGARLIRQNNKI